MRHLFRHVAIATVLAATALPAAAAADTAPSPDAARPVVLGQGHLELSAADFASFCSLATRQTRVHQMSLAMDLRQASGATRAYSASLEVSGQVTPVEDASGRSLAWAGEVVGVPGSTSYLTIKGACTPSASDGEVQGFVRAPGHKYLIGTDAHDRTLAGVTDVDPDALPAPQPDSLNLPDTLPATPERATAPLTPKAATKSVIDVAVGYTQAARNGLQTGEGSGYPSWYWRPRQAETEIRTTVAQMNRAFATSGVNAEIRLVRIFEVPAFYGSEDPGEALKQMDTGTGPIGSLARTVRDQSGADLVSVLTNVSKGDGEYTAGQGDLPQNENGSYTAPSRQTGNAAYSSIDVFSAIDGEPGFAHELGHNLGLMHDERTMNSQLQPIADANNVSIDYVKRYLNVPPVPAGQGYITPDAKWFTTMAYKVTCQPYAEQINTPDPSCQYTNTYSTPRLSAGSTLLGQRNTADAAAALNQTTPAIAAYRTARTS
ncbi:zinc-dependent metalloprotease family protein [Streptomyces sp. NBC_01264]|uniref:zinc-dependent metalloprotease family protein n=1 Tax=Streptomyces sp. NBC_01264 TaxID=2903804 RepID=UPI00224DF19B|nr:zinc-dependent metalloprotease family protein [Streptomyces sp. NBC_01264]MCX4782976.1 M12 family metallo-peptidase [Streptomyces sp. NBC_01264]